MIFYGVLTSVPRFAFEGIGHLMQYLLISNARFIQAANEFGIKKMMRNMLALQQNIKTIMDDSSSTQFDRAKRYYSLFLLSPPVRLTVHACMITPAKFSFRNCWTPSGKSRSSRSTSTRRSSIFNVVWSPVERAASLRLQIATTTCT